MQCPSCWRPISFDEKYAKVVACPYCNSILEFWEWELSKIWEQWYFIEFPTQFVVWQETKFKWKDLYVKGQLRYEYDWGFFDKFLCIVDGKAFYLKEDDWIISIVLDWKFEKNSLRFTDKEAWDNFEYDWKKMYIEEIWVFKLVNIKWFVDEILIPGKEYEYLNAVSGWKKYFFERESETWRIRLIREIQDFND